MGEVASAYAGCRTRIGELVSSLDAAQLEVPVPTCPKWTVHDVVAHVTGVVDDALAGRLEGAPGDPWTSAQVEARRGRAITDVVAEWNEKAPAFEQLLDAIGAAGPQAVLDVVSHEHDIRCAVARPGARDSDAVTIGLGFVGPGFVGSAAAQGVDVRVDVADGRSFGGEGARVTLAADAFELVRAMTGRRSVEQLRKLPWAGAGDADVDRLVAAFTYGPFRPAERPIDE
ncbi:MAG TPA: maleylpyruvate isomerase family mycothiol-dependent enzyme [Acidimicrobiales bacterium]